MNLHTADSVLHCHYFNNDKKCPFEVLGCKFLHSKAKVCKEGHNCQRRLCPLRHLEEEEHAKSNYATESNVEDKDISEDTCNFVTSTQVKRKFNCEECKNQTQCVDCFVRQENPDTPNPFNPRQGAAGRNFDGALTI